MERLKAFHSWATEKGYTIEEREYDIVVVKGNYYVAVNVQMILETPLEHIEKEIEWRFEKLKQFS